MLSPPPTLLLKFAEEGQENIGTSRARKLYRDTGEMKRHVRTQRGGTAFCMCVYGGGHIIFAYSEGSILDVCTHRGKERIICA